jgi:hypothetical protein
MIKPPSHHFVVVALLNLLMTLLLPSLAIARTDFNLPSGVKVLIDEEPFDKSILKVAGCGPEMPACYVNGQLALGAAFQVPTTWVKKLSVTAAGHTYDLDSSGMFNAWGKRPLEVRGAIRYFGGACSSVGNCRFRGIFSDGAGSFAAEWLVVEGRSTRTVFTDISDVLQLFAKQIDPPEIQ